MGNIYYEEKNYPLAIKMYRMALDTIPSVNKDMRVKIIKNIGHAFIKLGEFQDAIDSFENIMESEPDFQTGFNLVLCYYAIGDYERMKRWFSKLLTIEVPGTEEMDEDNLLEQKDHADTQATKSDPLKEYLKKERDQAYKYISQVAKLMAPVIEKDTMTGYDWILETLKAADFPTIESEIEIAKAIYYIKRKEFDKSITVFKSFEKKDKVMMAIAANNISFLYFLEKDYENAEKYAVIANNHHRYNAKALVNKGNCFFIREEFEHAKEHYLEAIGVEANCIEAIFNLGLANKRMGIYDESLQV
jgi:intraflagellar transport protein 88